MRNEFKEFFFTYFLFRVDKDKKKTIQEKVTEADYAGLKISLIAIAVFQFIMLITDFIRYGMAFDERNTLKRILYILLFFSCILFYILITITKIKCKSYIPFFIIVNTAVLTLLGWGIGISVSDSYNVTSILVYTYVTLTTVAMITLEPWLIITDLTLSLIALITSLTLCTGRGFDSGMIGILINALSVYLLAIMLAIFNFYRRVNTLLLQMEVKDLNDELSIKAYVDDLTKLYNRRYLSENMDKKMNYSGTGSAIILFDIDNFKKLNDTHGHLSGDLALRSIGQIILARNDYSYAVRYGGEEFLLFFKACTQDQIYKTAEEIRNTIANQTLVMIDGTKKKISISLGIARAINGITYSEMIDAADEALYIAKSNGKNQTVVADQSLDKTRIPDQLKYHKTKKA